MYSLKTRDFGAEHCQTAPLLTHYGLLKQCRREFSGEKQHIPCEPPAFGWLFEVGSYTGERELPVIMNVPFAVRLVYKKSKIAVIAVLAAHAVR